MESSPAYAQGRRRALIVSISEYEKLSPLDFCKNDGNKMYEILIQLGYEIPAAYKLIGGRIEYARLHDTIIDFFYDSTIDPKDTIIFYFAGHGVLGDDGEHYFSSSEVDPDIPRKRGFSFNDLSQIREQCNSKTIFTILDCCYAGAVKQGGRGEDDSSRVAKGIIEEKSIAGEGRCILAACKPMQKAYEFTKQGHGFFTYYLSEALKDTTCIDEEGDVTPELLSRYIDNKIASLPGVERPKQRPFLNCVTTGKISIAHHTLQKQSIRHEQKIPQDQILLKLLEENNVLEFNSKRPLHSTVELTGARLAKAQLSKVNFNDAELGDADLSEADLNGADLTGSNLSRSNLTHAKLANCECRRANLTNANLDRADLSNTNLVGAKLQGVTLTDANISGANLDDTNLYKANLSGANLAGTSLRSAHLEESDLSELIDLSGADFSDADLTRATLRGAKRKQLRATSRLFPYIADRFYHQSGPPILKNSNLSDADLTSASLEKADLRGVILTGTVFKGANLRWAILSDSVLTEHNLSGADLWEADLSGADLRGADLSGANLTGADLGNTNLLRINLSRVNLAKRDLSELNLSEANLTGADLTNTELINTNLEDANLTHADLTDANLRGTRLAGSNFTGAILDRAYLAKAKDLPIKDGEQRGAYV